MFLLYLRFFAALYQSPRKGGWGPLFCLKHGRATVNLNSAYALSCMSTTNFPPRDLGCYLVHRVQRCCCPHARQKGCALRCFHHPPGQRCLATAASPQRFPLSGRNPKGDGGCSMRKAPPPAVSRRRKAAGAGAFVRFLMLVPRLLRCFPPASHGAYGSRCSLQHHTSWPQSRG